MHQMSKVMKNLTLVTQFGLSFIMPLLICLLICMWLVNKFEVGTWVFIIGFFLGLGSSFVTAYKFFQSIMKTENKEDREKKDKVCFNNHQ